MDNVILIFLALVSGIQIFKHRRKKLAGNRAFMWFYCLLTWVVLAITTAYLGIAVRQKWMFAPILLYLFISMLSKSRQPLVRRTPNPYPPIAPPAPPLALV